MAIALALFVLENFVDLKTIDDEVAIESGPSMSFGNLTAAGAAPCESYRWSHLYWRRPEPSV